MTDGKWMSVSPNSMDSCLCIYCRDDMTDNLDNCMIVITAKQTDTYLWKQLLQPVCPKCQRAQVEDPFE